MKTKKVKTNKLIAIGVTDGDDYFDESSDVAIVEFSPNLKKLILDTHAQLLKIKEVNSSVYDIRTFDSSPEFLSSGEFDETAGTKQRLELEKKESVSITPKMFDKLGSCSTARTEMDLLQVGTDSFFWTGYYKHTTVRFTTSAISIEALKAM